jgi:purine-cytosine permease-like protein
LSNRRQNRLLAVERHGVDAVPKAERTKGWADLFVIYTGLNIAMVTLLVGGLLVPALSWAEVVFVMLVGNTSVITPKAAIRDHFKTGHSKSSGTVF